MYYTAICSLLCVTNKQCTAPDTCTCVSGWIGNDCLTDIAYFLYWRNILTICNSQCNIIVEYTAIILLTIDVNECSLNSCYYHCTNTNGSYYCSCDTSSVLANDGIHCLARVCIKKVELFSTT